MVVGKKNYVLPELPKEQSLPWDLDPTGENLQPQEKRGTLSSWKGIFQEGSCSAETPGEDPITQDAMGGREGKFWTRCSLSVRILKRKVLKAFLENGKETQDCILCWSVCQLCAKWLPAVL